LTTETPAEVYAEPKPPLETVQDRLFESEEAVLRVMG